MHLGIIGGIGPAATVVYYERLTQKMRELGQPLDLTIVQADAPTLVRNNTGDHREAQAEIYAELIDRLKASGADCAAITSLGGHFCYAETEKLSSLPLISGVTPLDDFFAQEGIETVGLLGTEVVMRTRLYGQLEKTKAVVLEEDIADLGRTYLDVALSGVCSEEARQTFFAAGRSMVQDQGADAIVLAGTDLGLAFDGRDPGYKVIDALDVHVAQLVRLATGQEELPV